jgi:hypothetical protein
MENKTLLENRIREEPLETEENINKEETTTRRNWFCRDFEWEEPIHKLNGTNNRETEEERKAREYVYEDETYYYTYEEEYIASQLYKDGVDIDAYYEMLDRDLDDPLFKPNEEMEQLDEELRVAYYTPVAYPDDGPRPTREDGAHEDRDKDEEYEIEFVEDSDTQNDKKKIKKYKKMFNITETEAFEILRRCHYCGTTKIKFGDIYCGPRCQDYHIDFNYPCYWNKEQWEDDWANNCVVCCYGNECALLCDR